MRFPSNIEKGMPFVKFIPYKYGFPDANVKDPKTSKTPWKGSENITLYIPGGFTESLASQWSEQQLIGGSETDYSGMAGSIIGEIAKSSAGSKVTATMSAANGKIPYPTELLVFGGVTPINLDFSFELVPISEDESDNIYKICDTFKKLSIPKKSTEGLPGIPTLDYPAVWDLKFANVSGIGFLYENEYKDMALVNVGVSYSPGSTTLNTFHSQYPVQIKLDLKFQGIKRFMYE